MCKYVALVHPVIKLSLHIHIFYTHTRINICTTYIHECASCTHSSTNVPNESLITCTGALSDFRAEFLVFTIPILIIEDVAEAVQTGRWQLLELDHADPLSIRKKD